MFKSFGFAVKGLKLAISSQQNFRIHVLVAVLVVAAGIFARLSAGEWCIIMITISMVLAMEAVNTAIEKLVDFVSPGFHEQAGTVKDISAGAVLITAIGAVIVGLVIFLPKMV
ncbi:MAG: diacylglycerol kinase family protein [Bacteroidales bacterium]|nr:diacylglycerol kinase family protein [Bacteroidales bacterium]